MSHDAAPGGELHKGLKQRHLAMIAIGGVIGAGMFVGSGVVMNSIGPPCSNACRRRLPCATARWPRP